MENVLVQVIDRQTGNPLAFNKDSAVNVLCNFSANLGTIKQGEKVPLSLTFVSNSTDSFGLYNYYLRIISSNYPQTDIFMTLRVVSDQQGKILFKVSDLFTGTYNQHNQFIWGVEKAKILIQNDDDYLETWTGYTDGYGELLTDNLTAGSYKCRISSPNHQPKVIRLWVKPGLTQSQEVVLDFNLVTIEWEVVETLIKDVYTIILKFVYLTDVPAPVLITEPGYITLDLTMKPGDVFNAEYNLINQGLVRADNIEVTLPPNDEYFDYQLMSGIPDSLGAKQSIKISYRMICKKPVLTQDGSRAGSGSYQGCIGNSHATNSKCGGSGSAPHCVGGGQGSSSGGGVPDNGPGGWSLPWGGKYVPEKGKLIHIPTNQVITANECDEDPDDESGVDCYSGAEGSGGEGDEGGSAVHLVKGHYFDAAADLTVKVPGGEASVIRRFNKRIRPRTSGYHTASSVASRASGASAVLYNPLVNSCPTHSSSTTSESFIPGQEAFYDYNWYWDHAIGCSLEKEFYSTAMTSDQQSGSFSHSVSSVGFNGQTYSGSGSSKLFSESSKNSALKNQYNLFKVYKKGSSTLRLIDDQFNGWIDSLKWRWENKNGEWREMNFNGKVIASGNKTNALVSYKYNDAGYLTGVFDRNGRQIFWYFYQDRPGLISSVKDCYGREVKYQYANENACYARTPQGYPAALLTLVKSSNGFETNYTYSGDKLVKKSYPNGYQVHITYESAHEKTIIGYHTAKDQTGYKSRSAALDASNAMATVTWRVTSIMDSLGQGKKYEYAREKLQNFDYKLDGVDAKYIAMAYSSAYASGSSSGATGSVIGGSSKSNKLYYRKITTTRGKVTEYWFNRYYQLIKKQENGDPTDRIIRDGRTEYKFDANGNPTITYYDEWDNITKIEYADGSTVKYVYDSTYHQLLEETNERCIKTKYEYDAQGQLIKIRQAWGTSLERQIEITYNEVGDPETITRLGDSQTAATQTQLTYDMATGNLTSVTDPEGHTAYFSNHDAQGNAKQIRMKADDGSTDLIWTLDYYHDGEIKSVTDPLGYVTQFLHDPAANKRTFIDAEGKITEYLYDLRGNLKQTMQKLADNTEIKTIYNYTFDGLLLSVLDPESKPTNYEYDKKNRLTKMIDGNLHEITYTYNNDSTAGNSGCNTCQKGTVSLPKRIDYPTHYVEFEYDLRGRQTKASGFKPDNTLLYSESTHYSIDNNYNFILKTDRMARETRYDYDDLNRLIKITRFVPGGTDEITQYSYDNRNNVIAVKDANQQMTRFEYDGNNRLKKEIRPLNQTMNYSYYPSGRLKSVTDSKQQRIEFTYNANGYLMNQKVYRADNSVERSIDFTYDKIGHLTSYADGISSGAYGYDNLYRKLSETVHYGSANGNPLQLNHFYSYYKNSAIKTFTAPSGDVYEYSYDPLNLLKDIKLPGNAGMISTTKYNYLQPEEITYPGGTKKIFEYDALQRVTRLMALDIGENEIMNFSLAYDRMDNVISKTNNMSLHSIQNLQPGEAHTYSYDKLYRLTEVHKNPADSGSSESLEGFCYDPLGNRLSQTKGAATSVEWTYNANNELQGYDSISYTHDANGSITEKLVNNALVMSFDYNAENRLQQVRDSSGNTIAAYYYDPFGRRLWKDISGSRTYYHYANEGLIAEYNTNGFLAREYGFNPNSLWGTHPLFQKISGTYYYYHNDHLGTPLKITSASGQTVWQASYNAFGEAIVTTETIQNPLRFPGQYHDTETGLHYNFHRYYAPELGRYMKSDPLGIRAGLNLYSYVGNRPNSNIDQLGLFSSNRSLRSNEHIDTHVIGGIPFGQGKYIPIYLQRIVRMPEGTIVREWITPIPGTEFIPGKNPFEKPFNYLKCVTNCMIRVAINDRASEVMYIILLMLVKKNPAIACANNLYALIAKSFPLVFKNASDTMTAIDTIKCFVNCAR
jgi:RHS repeat-associated protein